MGMGMGMGMGGVHFERVDVMDKTMKAVDPVTEIIFVIDDVIFRLWGPSRKTIRTMVSAGDVY